LALPVFLPPVNPAPGSTVTTTPRVRLVRFGDGYSQRTRDGLNTIERERRLIWREIPKAHAHAIVAFLEARGGAEAFWYTFPGEPAPEKVICPSWSEQPEAVNVSTVTAAFQRVYDAES
jgi:phage-related protein